MAHETSSLTSAQLNEKLRHLRGLTCEWTLSEDDELCSVLDELSRSLVSRVDATLGKLNSSTAATTRAVVNVANMDTHLASFANDQFIESRVYDEPCVVSAETPRSVKKTAQRQEETVENICEAVSLSFAMIKSHFKRIEMRPEDFDEDDDPTFIPDPVFEPFDSHLSRPLPFLIGTNDWNTSLSAGVRDTPVELAKVQKDEVVIGLPAFVQPHLATAATSCPQPTQPQVMNAVRGIDEEKERAIGKMAESADSRRSDHSGLFSSDSTDDEATINKEPSRSYNTGARWRGVAAEPFVPREHSGASRGRQVEEAPDTKQAFAPNAPRSPTFTHVTSTPPDVFGFREGSFSKWHSTSAGFCESSVRIDFDGIKACIRSRYR
uniref:Integrase catalytic domain-containing protein n=1 Tax=Parascaris univalens TaxID=6257 RepID=A0A915AVM2_PARUN